MNPLRGRRDGEVRQTEPEALGGRRQDYCRKEEGGAQAAGAGQGAGAGVARRGSATEAAIRCHGASDGAECELDITARTAPPIRCPLQIPGGHVSGAAHDLPGE